MTHSHLFPILSPLILLGATVACGPDPSVSTPLVAETASAARASNGRAWNGRAWNGRAWNGRAWNGRAWNGSSLGATGIDGAGWRAEGVNGTVLSGAHLSLQGSSLIIGGMSMSSFGGSVVLSPMGQLDLAMRIDGPTPLVSPTGASLGIDTYALYGALDAAWEPMFVDDAGMEVMAIALAGEWNTADDAIGTYRGGAWSDDGRITFAARGHALAKCVEFGYKPWNAGGGDLHRSCVRMVRADFCGDGNSWTHDGTMLNIYDRSGIQARETSRPYADDNTYRWQFEAEWSPYGAICVDAYRIAEPTATLPSCAVGRLVDALAADQCGTNTRKKFGAFGNASIMSEYATQGAPLFPEATSYSTSATAETSATSTKRTSSR